MTTWSTIQALLPAWIAKCAKQPTGAVCWADVSTPIADPYILINVINEQDVITLQDVTTSQTGEKSRNVQSHRTLTISIRVESGSENGKVSAGNTANLLRMRMQRWDFLEELSTKVGLSLAGVPEPVRNLSYDHNDVKIHARQFDCDLNCLFTDSDVDESLGVFDKIGVGGTDTVETDTIQIPEVELKA